MHEALDEPTRIPGLQLLEIPGDPTTLPSEHAERINVLESQIAEKDVVAVFLLVASFLKPPNNWMVLHVWVNARTPLEDDNK